MGEARWRHRAVTHSERRYAQAVRTRAYHLWVVRLLHPSLTIGNLLLLRLVGDYAIHSNAIDDVGQMRRIESDQNRGRIPATPECGKQS
jgi:hypothetical protein